MELGHNGVKLTIVDVSETKVYDRISTQILKVYRKTPCFKLGSVIKYPIKKILKPGKRLEEKTL